MLCKWHMYICKVLTLGNGQIMFYKLLLENGGSNNTLLSLYQHHNMSVVLCLSYSM